MKHFLRLWSISGGVRYNCTSQGCSLKFETERNNVLGHFSEKSLDRLVQHFGWQYLQIKIYWRNLYTWVLWYTIFAHQGIKTERKKSLVYNIYTPRYISEIRAHMHESYQFVLVYKYCRPKCCEKIFFLFLYVFWEMLRIFKLLQWKLY